jgi:hypothetical protein
MKQALLVVAFGLLLTGCGKHYWEAPGRGLAEFQSDTGQCIQDAKTKFEVSEGIYRRCMRAQGWRRVQTHYPTNTQFRGPEDEDDFYAPPNPLSARGTMPSRADDPTCVGPMASRPSHCRPTPLATERPAVGLGPSQEIIPTTLVGTWSGTVYNAKNGTTYPFTIAFRDDGSWHSTSTTPPRSFGTWELKGDRVVWKSITSGRTGTFTIHEANGGRILRMIPDDRLSTIELTPVR